MFTYVQKYSDGYRPTPAFRLADNEFSYNLRLTAASARREVLHQLIAQAVPRRSFFEAVGDPKDRDEIVLDRAGQEPLLDRGDRPRSDVL